MRRLALAAVAVAVCAGCGGGSGFARHAQALCLRERHAIQGARTFGRQVVLALDEARQLRALGSSGAQRAAADRLAAAVELQAQDARYLHSAQLVGDQEAIQGAMGAGRLALIQARRAARDLGAPACG